MHILILTTGIPGPYTPNQGIFFWDQAKALQKYGHQVGLISINPVSIKNILKKGIGKLGKEWSNKNGVQLEVYRYASIPKQRLQVIRKLSSKGLQEADSYIQKFGKPDVVHAHNFQAAHLATLIKEKYQIPFVVTEHSSNFLANTVAPALIPYAKKVYMESGANLAVSKQFAEVMKGFSKQEFQVMENTTDVAFFTPSNKPKDRFIFLSAASLIPVKNQRLQIEAFASIHPQLDNAQLWIAGAGPNETELKNLVKNLGMESHIHFKGYLNREQMREIMQASSVFLVSSLHETFGVVIIEAMSCGLPVISTRCVGPETIIQNESLGILTGIDISSFADAMLHMYKNHNTYSAQHIRQYIIDTYSEEVIAQKLTDVYLTIKNKSQA